MDKDELVLRLKGDISDLVAKFKKADEITKNTFSKMGGAIGKFTAPIGNAIGKLNSMAGVIGVTLGAGALVKLTKGSLDSADALAKMSANLGVSAEFLQSMRFAAGQSGIAQSEFDASIQKFTKNIGDAATGAVLYKEQFDRLGVSLKDNQGNLKSTEVLFKEVADGLTGVENEAEKAAIQFALFGKAGIKLNSLMKNGSAGLKEYEQKAKDLGIVLDGDLLKGAENANDAIDILQKVALTGFTNALVQLTPHIVSFAQDLTVAAQGAAQFAKDIGLIEETDANKVVQSLKADIVDLEQEIISLEQSDGFLDGLFKDSKLEDKRKKLKELQAELFFAEPKAEQSNKAELAQKEQDEITAIQQRGLETRAQLSAEDLAREAEERSKVVEEKIAALEEENALLSEINFAANEEKIAENQRMMDALVQSKDLSDKARLQLEANRIAKEREMNDQALSGLSTTFGNIMTLSKGHNRQLFEMSKAAAIATAVVQGVLGVQRALANPPGPPFSTIQAAAAGTTAAVNVARIQGTTFNKGTDYVPGIGNTDTVPAILTPGERVVPKQTNKDLTEYLKGGGRSQNLNVVNNISFNGLSINSDEAKLALIKAMNDGVRELGAKVII